MLLTAEELFQGQSKLWRGDAVENEVQRVIGVGEEKRDGVVQTIAMLLVQILKDLSDDDRGEENDEDEIENQEHVGDLLGAMRSSSSWLPFETGLHRRSTQGEEQPVGDDRRTDSHDEKRNEHVGEQVDDVVGLFEELEVSSRGVVRANDQLSRRGDVVQRREENRLFRTHEEENVTVEQGDDQTHDQKDPIGGFRTTEAFVQLDHCARDGTIDGDNGQDP